MYETIKRLYEAGQLTKSGVEAAVQKGWITQGQADALTEAAKRTNVQTEDTGDD